MNELDRPDFSIRLVGWDVNGYDVFEGYIYSLFFTLQYKTDDIILDVYSYYSDLTMEKAAKYWDAISKLLSLFYPIARYRVKNISAVLIN